MSNRDADDGTGSPSEPARPAFSRKSIITSEPIYGRSGSTAGLGGQRKSVVDATMGFGSTRARRQMSEGRLGQIFGGGGGTVLDPGLLGTPEIKHKHEMRPPILPPKPMDGVPEGLELLVDLDKLKVKRQAEFMPEIMGNYETAKRYDILNNMENRIYFAAETNSTNILTCGGLERPFQITILDFTGRVVLQLDRGCDQALYLTNCCFCCCCWLGRIGGKVVVRLGDGTPIGEIVHAFNCYRPLYNIVDLDGSIIMQIRGIDCGDNCIFRYCKRGNTMFAVETIDGEEVGLIQKEFARIENFLGRQLFILEHCDVFGFEVTFTEDLDLRLKALLFATIFLLNNLYFKYEFPKYQKDVTVDLMPDLDLVTTSEIMEGSHTSFTELTNDEMFRNRLDKRPSLFSPFND